MEIADPAGRLARVRAEMSELKAAKEALAAQSLVTLGRYTPYPLASLVVRLGYRLPQRELVTVTTNVPGPRQPLYGLGRRLVELIPYVPIATSLRTGVSIFSYCDQVTFGITADYASVPDVEVLAEGIEKGLAELLAAATLPGGRWRLVMTGDGWRSRWADVGGPVRYLDFGGPRRAPLLVCVHGLGGSAVNWLALAPLLTGRYRVLAPDLAGHGLTRSACRGTDVPANVRLLEGFLDQVADGPAVLMGNSMGGMICVLAATAAPEAVSSLILVDPALPFRPARPDPAVAAMFAVTGIPVLGRATLRRVATLAASSGGGRACWRCAAPIPAGCGRTSSPVMRRSRGSGRTSRRRARAWRVPLALSSRPPVSAAPLWPTGRPSARSRSRSCCCTVRPTGWYRSRPLVPRPGRIRTGRW